MTAYSPARPIRIGTRASPLALAQAYETRDRLIAAHGLPEEAVVIVSMTTTGDQRAEVKLSEIGGKGLFTKEVEDSLIAKETDLAVHSMKDMPTEQPPGLEISTLLPREDVRDAFISMKYGGIADLPEGALVGTASLRRQAQLLLRRPDLKVGLFRGNVQTRLRKLKEGEADATFLAMAGLSRLGMRDVATSPIEPDDMLPAVSQGAIGIEIVSSNDDIRAALAPLNCDTTTVRVTAERAFLRTLDGSCRTPIAALAEIKGDRLTLRGEILRPDGSEHFTTSREGALSDADAMGRDAAARDLGFEVVTSAGGDGAALLGLARGLQQDQGLVLHPRGADTAVSFEALDHEGFDFREMVVYDAIQVTAFPKEVEWQQPTAALVYSTRTAAAFAEALSRSDLIDPASLTVIGISEAALAPLKTCGFKRLAAAKQPNEGAVFDVLQTHLPIPS
ncbi:UNVERIFIED_CONTAM: hypothetical protein GTU68_030182 [Idotea baltica]|nr:hypothetical protein [Idotea baltica]